MLSVKNTKNKKYICIIGILKDLLVKEMITPSEYQRAEKYYRKITGADIVLID